MAKIPLSKLGLKKNDDVAILHQGTKEEPLDIEIKQYLPIDEKFQIITNIINNAVDANNFYNPAKVQAFMDLYIIDAYTNVKIPKEKITDEEGNELAEIIKDVSKVYDLIVSSGLRDDIFAVIPGEELRYISDGTYALIQSIYKYTNSALGVLTQLVDNYEGMDKTVENLTQNLSDPENMKLLRDVITKLG